MKVLVACEFSGVVRDAFSRRGFESWSCDLLETRAPGNHICGDIRTVDLQSFDLLIAHPPCTALCVSGNRHYAGTQAREEALEFIRYFLNSKVRHLALENPVGVISTAIRKPDQYIQPWQFGHGETKKTGLWLRNLPLLLPTNIVEGREQRIWKMPPSPDRGYLRSITYRGIAEAMADQWGKFIEKSIS